MVLRVPFLDVDHFAHRHRESVREEYDVSLKRNVMVLKSQRIPVHMVHVFKHVVPGRYTVQFRIRLPESKLAFLYRNPGENNVVPASIVVRSVPWTSKCACDAPDKSEITPLENRVPHGGLNFFPELPPIISNISNGLAEKSVQVAEQTINARSWIRIWEHSHITRFNTCPPTLNNASLRFDSATDWFFLELKPFQVNQYCQLQVEFKAEAEEFRWKKGMYWDFLELRQVPAISG